jgi:hypothetical protein
MLYAEKNRVKCEEDNIWSFVPYLCVTRCARTAFAHRCSDTRGQTVRFRENLWRYWYGNIRNTERTVAVTAARASKAVALSARFLGQRTSCWSG